MGAAPQSMSPAGGTSVSHQDVFLLKEKAGGWE